MYYQWNEPYKHGRLIPLSIWYSTGLLSINITWIVYLSVLLPAEFNDLNAILATIRSSSTIFDENIKKRDKFFSVCLFWHFVNYLYKICSTCEWYVSTFSGCVLFAFGSFFFNSFQVNILFNILVSVALSEFLIYSTYRLFVLMSCFDTKREYFRIMKSRKK